MGTPLGNTEQNKWKEKEIEYNKSFKNKKGESCLLKRMSCHDSCKSLWLIFDRILCMLDPYTHLWKQVQD